MRALVAIAIAAAALGGLGAASADAAKRHRHHHHWRPASFEGSCDFTGAVRFTPPMTTTPQPVEQHAAASGTCSGTFVDHRGRTHIASGAPVRYRAVSGGDAISCALGVDSGAGRLAFPYGSLAFTMDEYRAAATPLLEISGRDGGSALMPVTPAPSADPIAAVQACSAGGLNEFDLSGHLQTQGPLKG